MPGLDRAYVLASFSQANLCEEMKTTLEHANHSQAYLLLTLLGETEIHTGTCYCLLGQTWC